MAMVLCARDPFTDSFSSTHPSASMQCGQSPKCGTCWIKSQVDIDLEPVLAKTIATEANDNCLLKSNEIPNALEKMTNTERDGDWKICDSIILLNFITERRKLFLSQYLRVTRLRSRAEYGPTGSAD